jgi:hypothetical protein
MTLDTYGHVFDELEDAEPVTAEELIRQARSRRADSNRGPLHYERRRGSSARLTFRSTKPNSGVARDRR